MVHCGPSETRVKGTRAGMADDLQKVALDLKNFLVKVHRVREVDGPDPLSSDWRTWEVSFTYRGLRRHFWYRVQRQDPAATMLQALQADTTGELMVRIPRDGTDELMPNEIYYPPHG